MYPVENLSYYAWRKELQTNQMSAKPNQDASSFIMIMAENARSTTHARL